MKKNKGTLPNETKLRKFERMLDILLSCAGLVLVIYVFFKTFYFN